MKHAARWLAASVALIGFAFTSPASAQSGEGSNRLLEQPAGPQTSDKPSEQEKAPSIATSLTPSLADPGGVRSPLEAAGITYRPDLYR